MLRPTVSFAFTLAERLVWRATLSEPLQAKINKRIAAESSSYAEFFNVETKSTDWDLFLAEHSLSRSSFRHLLSNEPGCTDFPAWAQELVNFDSRLSGRRYNFNPNLSVSANLARPIADLAWQDFLSSKTHSHHGISSNSVTPLRKSLLQRLAFVATQASELEFPNPRQNRSPLERPEAEYREALTGFGQQGTQFMLARYPALARLWTVQSGHWSRFARDFLGHAADFSRKSLGGTSIERIEPDLSDLHQGNRSVVRVRFTGGRQWYYKPRAGTQEMIWFRLLQQINGAGFPLTFKVPGIITKESHCWVEAVRRRPCRNLSEASDYFYRIGALLYLLYRLRGVDFHAENVVADRDNPILIDCETLLHPDSASVEGRSEPAEGLLRTGMLPVLEREFGVSGPGMGMMGLNGVLVRNRRISYAAFVDAIGAGFSAIHKFLIRRSREKLLAQAVLDLQKLETRRIQRPSMHYWMILQRSLAPAMLRDGLKRSIFLHALCWPVPIKIRREEVSALERADIPIFFGVPAQLRPIPSPRELDQCCNVLRRALCC